MKRTALPPRRTPIRKVSTKRQRELREYSKKRRAFLLAHPWCQVWLAQNGKGEADVSGLGLVELPADTPGFILNTRVPRSCDIHHKNKRHGSRLNDESQWMAVSREAHQWLHSHPREARAKGWLV